MPVTVGGEAMTLMETIKANNKRLLNEKILMAILMKDVIKFSLLQLLKNLDKGICFIPNLERDLDKEYFDFIFEMEKSGLVKREKVREEKGFRFIYKIAEQYRESFRSLLEELKKLDL